MLSDATSWTLWSSYSLFLSITLHFRFLGSVELDCIIMWNVPVFLSTYCMFLHSLHLKCLSKALPAFSFFHDTVWWNVQWIYSFQTVLLTCMEVFLFVTVSHSLVITMQWLWMFLCNNNPQSPSHFKKLYILYTASELSWLSQCVFWKTELSHLDKISP